MPKKIKMTNADYDAYQNMEEFSGERVDFWEEKFKGGLRVEARIDGSQHGNTIGRVDWGNWGFGYIEWRVLQDGGQWPVPERFKTQQDAVHFCVGHLVRHAERVADLNK